jgi:hypothetical protein
MNRTRNCFYNFAVKEICKFEIHLDIVAGNLKVGKIWP